MQGFEFVEGVTDFLVPYVMFIGTTYVLVISSVTYGVYAVTTVCGPLDPLVRSIREGESIFEGFKDSLLPTEGPWNWKYWVGLFSLPYALLLASSRAFEGVLSFSSLVTLSAIKVLPYIFEPYAVTGGAAENMDLISQLVQERRIVLLGLLGFKRFYTLFYNRILTPLVVGKRAHSRKTVGRSYQ
jgi:hypothetical protein